MTIAHNFDVFLLDLDGVVRLGGEALPDAVDAVKRLGEMGKQIRFLTNDPRPRRREVVDHLDDLGIPVRVDQVVTSGWATARYLRRAGLATAATVGSGGLRAELGAQGVGLTEEDPDAVVVGADEETSYRDIRRATRHVARGAEFVGTNPDGAFPTPDGPAPGAGAIVRAVEAASGTSPTVVGKPEPLMFELALEAVPDAARAVMVGDNAYTDVLGAHRAGHTGILVSDDEPGCPVAASFRQPDATISTLGDLFTRSVDAWEPPGYAWTDCIRPGVAAVVLDSGGDLLLVKRSDRKQWALPTGRVEVCETLTGAVTREVREETGLEIEVDRRRAFHGRPARRSMTRSRSRGRGSSPADFREQPSRGGPVSEDGSPKTASYPFLIVDAFARRALEGNPCAVVLDADGFDEGTMQALARETNLSETAFVARSTSGEDAFTARYFTPEKEIPFAGHPTMATVRALVDADRVRVDRPGTTVRLTLPAGDVDVHVARKDRELRFTMTQRPPEWGRTYDPSGVAETFGLAPEHLLDRPPVQTVSTGTPMLMVRVRDVDALRRARMDFGLYRELRSRGDFFSPHLYCLPGLSQDAATYARHFGIPPDTIEDPFTGSATGAMAAHLWRHGVLDEPRFVAEQGHDMGRPGRAHVEVVGDRSSIRSVRVGGTAVTVVRGTLTL